MAKKYGIGENAGKKAVTYTATAPDGSILKKKSFNVNSEKALIGAFQHEGKWMPSGVTETIQDWPGQIFLEATRK